jgi:hypothetical protein
MKLLIKFIILVMNIICHDNCYVLDIHDIIVICRINYQYKAI